MIATPAPATCSAPLVAVITNQGPACAPGWLAPPANGGVIFCGWNGPWCFVTDPHTAVVIQRLNPIHKPLPVHHHHRHHRRFIRRAI